ncbi:ABC transporter ATP-binding protein [bacterium]|nr:ABC transporter ATP-binding protein [bacterium]
MLSVQNLCKAYGPIQAADRVSFHIRSGCLTILAGADGAGKSTIIKMILGLEAKDSGTIRLQGHPVEKDYSRITRITGYMPERFSLYSDLSVEENMNFFADIQKVPVERREKLKHQLLERTGMLPFRKRRTGALSGGMKQKLALSTILLSSPQVILLDEPTTGVDPLSRIEFSNIIDQLKKEGKSLVASTPYLEEAEKGDQIIFLRKGKKIKEGPIRELKENFPARIYQIRPKEDVFAVMKQLQEKEELKKKVYMKGGVIKYMQRGPTSLLPSIPSKEMKEVEPTLEDIYLYYERSSDESSPAG